MWPRGLVAGGPAVPTDAVGGVVRAAGLGTITRRHIIGLIPISHILNCTNPGASMAAESTTADPG